MNLIIGPGAVGTVLTAALQRAGENVAVLVTPARADAYAAREDIIVETANGKIWHQGPAPAVVTTIPDNIDNIYLCTKHRDLEPALAQLPTTLNGKVYVCQNGVGLQATLAQRFPQLDLLTTTIMFNAQRKAPLHAVLTTKAEVLIDTADPAIIQRHQRGGLVVKRGSTTVSWGKLLINLNNAIGAATDTTFKDILTNKTLLQIYVRLLDEAVAVLNAANINFELPVPLPYAHYRRFLLHGGPLPWWVAKFKNGLDNGAFPSMVADIKAGALTEIEQLNGVIVQLGQQHGIATPTNQNIVALVHELETQATAQPLTPTQLLNAL